MTTEESKRAARPSGGHDAEAQSKARGSPRFPAKSFTLYVEIR